MFIRRRYIGIGSTEATKRIKKKLAVILVKLNFSYVIGKIYIYLVNNRQKKRKFFFSQNKKAMKSFYLRRLSVFYLFIFF